MPGNDFDWSDEDLRTIPRQGKIAVYSNIDGDLAIREQGDWCQHEDDHWIIVARANVPLFVQAICQVMGVEQVLPPTALLLPNQAPSQAPLSAAERQRRRRARQRDSVTERHDGVTDSVTPRDGEQEALNLDVAAE